MRTKKLYLEVINEGIMIRTLLYAGDADAVNYQGLCGSYGTRLLICNYYFVLF